MQKGPCLNLNKAVKTCKHIAKDHENNNKFVHLRVSSSRVGVLFHFLYWCICNKCCSSQCKLYKLYLSCSVQEKSLLEVLLTGAITLPQVFYSCRKAKQNRKQNSFFFLYSVYWRRKIGKSGNCCGCFIIRFINKHCSTEVRKNKYQQLLLPWKNSDKHKYLHPFDSPGAKLSFSHSASRVLLMHCY